MQHDSKNFILAIVLSMAIIFGWQYFYAVPTQKKLETQTTSQGVTKQPAGAAGRHRAGHACRRPPSPRAGGDRLTASASRSIPRSSTARINLIGAQFDDIRLKHYRETVDPKSPEIALLNPSGTVGGYFAEQGFVAAAGTTVKLPDPKTEWQAPADAVLAPGKPVTLTWDNGEGLLFTRTISVEDDYLFTVKQEVRTRRQHRSRSFPMPASSARARPRSTASMCCSKA